MKRSRTLFLIAITFGIFISTFVQSVFAAQFARPINDALIESWSASGGGSNLYQSVDEVIANDSDFVFHTNENPASNYSTNLSSVTDPSVSTGHIIRWRYEKLVASGSVTIDITLRLKQGTTLIATRAFTNIGTSWTQDTYNLSAAEADSITNYSNLNFELRPAFSGLGVAEAEVSWLEFEVPGASPDTTPPTWNSLGTNITGNATVESIIQFQSRWSDNEALHSFIFSWNATGANCNTWQNDSTASFQSGNWTNTTKTVPGSCEGKQIGFKFYANDTSNNFNTTSEQLLNISQSPPTWRNLGESVSSPEISTAVTFFSQWSDYPQLDKYIFSWNATGSSCNIWQNDTSASFQSGNWTNTTKTIPVDCEGKTVGFRFYATDINGYSNSTSIDTVSVKAKTQISLPPPISGQPPPNPTILPPTEIPVPPPDTTFDIPVTGITIRLDPKLVITLYPLTKRKATIHNISEIAPSTYKILLCNQTEIASYEINITADLAYFCADYSAFPVEEPSISIFRFTGDDWSILSEDKVLKNTSSKIICGQISSTPYLVTGFQSTPDSKSALESIQEANNTIELARKQDIQTEQAEFFIQQALNNYYSCNYITASTLANQALNSLVQVPSIPVYVPIAIASSITMAGIWYYWVKVRVRMKKFK